MSVKKFRVELVERGDVRDFIEENHYSQNINGLKASYCFALYDPDGRVTYKHSNGETYSQTREEVNSWCGGTKNMIESTGFELIEDTTFIGAMIYGKPAMNNQASKYNKENPDKVLELRRLCCIDDTPKNTESYFIGRTLQWLKKNTDIETIISYADMTYGHEGTIYKASNFKHVGISPPGKVIMHEGRRYHDKTIRTKYKGRLKPFAQRIKDALEAGDAYYDKTQGKHIYLYTF